MQLKRSRLEIFDKRRRAYKDTFSHPHAETVLADLKRYCRGGETTFDTDAQKSAFLQGRQDVFFRITDWLNLTDAQIAALKEL